MFRAVPCRQKDKLYFTASGIVTLCQQLHSMHVVSGKERVVRKLQIIPVVTVNSTVGYAPYAYNAYCVKKTLHQLYVQNTGRSTMFNFRFHR